MNITLLLMLILSCSLLVSACLQVSVIVSRGADSSWGLEVLKMKDDGQKIANLDGKGWVYPMTYDGSGFQYNHQSGDKTASVYVIEGQGLWWKFTRPGFDSGWVVLDNCLGNWNQRGFNCEATRYC